MPATGRDTRVSLIFGVTRLAGRCRSRRCLRWVVTHRSTSRPSVLTRFAVPSLPVHKRPLLFLDVDGTLIPTADVELPSCLEGWNTTWQTSSNPHPEISQRPADHSCSGCLATSSGQPPGCTMRIVSSVRFSGYLSIPSQALAISRN